MIKFTLIELISLSKPNLPMKEIHIGSLIKKRVEELNIDTKRIISLFKIYSEKDINTQYDNASIDTSDLLKWSKLLEYDFFRIYTQHIILYAPVGKVDTSTSPKATSLPNYRKNVYTKEIIDFVLDLYTKKNKKIQEISDV